MMLLYDKDLNFLGPIDHALNVGVEQKLNELSTATLEVNAYDEVQKKIVVPASFVRLEDGEEDLGYYRFCSLPRSEHAPVGRVKYALQSGECTLLDDTLNGWHEIGGTGIGTRAVIEYILGYQSVQGTRRWVLGDCEFEDYYQYNFQDVTLLEAIMSLGEVLLEPYEFVFDTTAEPWTMHLRRAQSEAVCSLVYRRNMTRFRRSITGGVVTRLYGRGYGEGDNQLTIASVNGGKDYLDADAASMAKWGVRCGVHVDTRQTDPNTLMARMQAILDAGKNPTVSYEADAIDLWRATGMNWDHVTVGSKVLVLDEVLGESVTVRVKSRKKADIYGRPGDVSYTLDNTVADTAEELNEILEKIGVHELYSQGATNMYSMQIADNADASHPLVMRFYVPGNVLRINSLLMSWQLESFRTYVKSIGTAAESASTSASGGGATVTLPERTVRVEQVSAGAIDSDGGTMSKTSGPVNSSSSSVTKTGSSGKLTSDFSMNASGMMTQTGESGNHSHTVSSHTHSISIGLPGHGHTLGSSTSQTGGLVSVPDISGSTGSRAPGTNSHSGHSHSMSHYHEIEGHTHSMDHMHDMTHLHSITHEHVIPSMSFTLESHSHKVTIPAHTHEFEYGVYEGKRAESVSLVVDGTAIPIEDIGDLKELDITSYLAKDSGGKVTRGAWHKCEFVPSGITRITANLFFQVFIQSRGAGDY